MTQQTQQAYNFSIYKIEAIGWICMYLLIAQPKFQHHTPTSMSGAQKIVIIMNILKNIMGQWQFVHLSFDQESWNSESGILSNKILW